MVITMGVIIALDNLKATEASRRTDKLREESRFRYDINLKHLEEISELIENFNADRKLTPSPSGQCTYTFLTRVSQIIENYKILKSGIIDEHAAALEVEEDMLKEKLLLSIEQLSELDLYGNFESDFHTLIHRKRERIQQLYKDSSHLLSNTIPLPAVTEAVEFIFPDVRANPQPTYHETLDQLIPLANRCHELGLEVIADYILSHHSALSLDQSQTVNLP